MISCFEPLPIDTPLKNEPGVLDSALSNLLSSFDAGSLVTVPRGVSAETAPGPLVTEAGSDKYLRRLATESVAVRLGGLAGLAAIQFQDRVHLDEFLVRNVLCQGTLITGHADGVTIWVRATTAFRSSLDLPQLHVKMNGRVLVFNRQSLHCRDEFLILAEVKAVDLFALDWGPDPDGQIAAWLVTLTRGKLVRRTQRGRIHPRRDAWRDYLLRRLKATTAFDRATGGFWRKFSADAWQPLDEQQLTGDVRQLVISAPIPGSHTHTWCNDEWLVGMLRYLRRVLVGEVPFAITHLRAFVRGALVLSPGRDVTVRELYAAFSRFCRERQFPLMSPAAFQKQIPKVLNEPPWGRAKSKSVQRASRSQNGFRGVALRSSFGVFTS